VDTKLKRLIVDDERFYVNVLLELLKDKSSHMLPTALSRPKQDFDNQLDLILPGIMMLYMDGSILSYN